MSQLKINKEYAEKYNTWRQKEELQKLKDKYGNISDLDSESSSSESEDENAEALTASIERDWLKTYIALKKRDPKIYEKDAKFYQSDDDTGSGEEHVKVKKEKPVYLKDYERNVILEKGGQLSDESDSGEEDVPQKPSYYEEQDEIKQSFKAELHDSGDESSDSELFTKKIKTEKEEGKEEENYMSWLKEQKKGKKEQKQMGVELDSFKEYWNDPVSNDGEKFLKDFIMKQKYLDKDSDRIPSYDEIVNDGEDLSDDEDNLEKQEEFERKYNFRYEEPDQDFIKSFPRNIEDTVRRKESTRAEKRKELKERKKMEKERKKEEIKQLKNFKKKEIKDKLNRLKDVTGNQSLELNMEDLEGEFDPKKHDEIMKACFDEDYYEEGAEETKPVFSDDDEDDLVPENWDNWTGPDVTKDTQEDEQEPHIDDPDFIMDADYDPTKVVEKSKKKKKKSKFKQALDKAKPEFDPSKKTFEEYFDEYYALDYEDVIDDAPCRFRYRTVLPNDFGLSVDEVLTARDKELNAWVSLKKMSQYRTQEEENDDLRIFSHKSKNIEKKARVLTSLWTKPDKKDNTTEVSGKKGKKKKKIESEGNTTATATTTKVDFSENVTDVVIKKEYDDKKSEQSPNKKRKLQDQEDSKVKAKKKKITQGSSDSGSIDSITVKQEGDKILPTESKIKTESITVSADKEKQDSLMEGTSKVIEGTSSNIQISSSNKQKKKKKKSLTGSMTDSKPSHGADTSKRELSNVSEEASLNVQNIKTENKKKKKKKKKKLPKLSDERLKAYGINPKKLRYMKTDNFKHKTKVKE